MWSWRLRCFVGYGVFLADGREFADLCGWLMGGSLLGPVGGGGWFLKDKVSSLSAAASAAENPVGSFSGVGSGSSELSTLGTSVP